uniref:Uncharacterized protein n=1 Tax=Rhizophora mucronata TaxID=61149 RepID=A0A2P2QRN8_RHIMU
MGGYGLSTYSAGCSAGLLRYNGHFTLRRVFARRLWRTSGAALIPVANL